MSNYLGTNDTINQDYNVNVSESKIKLWFYLDIIITIEN